MEIGQHVLDGHYEVLQHVKGWKGGECTAIGKKGVCRYCQPRNNRSFRKIAHTFPEALGNKWVTSLDECDDCNKLFSVYEDALVKAVGPLLTVGGTRGKGNAIRQTGRSKGRSILSRTEDGVPPRISVYLKGAIPEDYLAVDLVTGRARIIATVAPVPFTPRYAYKALTKMGLALLPAEEFANYEKLLAWINERDDPVEIPSMVVGLSFGFVGYAPDLVAGTLLRRVNADHPLPHIVFILSAGSVTMQIDLKSDWMEGSWPPPSRARVSIRWANVIGPDDHSAIRIDYGDPVWLDWSSREHEPQFVESLIFDFDRSTLKGAITPKLRPGADVSRAR